MREKGFIFAIIPVIIIIVIAVVIFLPKLRAFFNSTLQTPTPSSVSVSTMTPSPTPILQTPTPFLSPKPATPKPTPVPVSGPPGAGYSSITVATEKGNFSASVLSIDLNSARMITDTGNDGDCSSGCIVMSLQDYVNRNSGFAGINGTYFCPAEPAYSYCGAGNNYDFPVWNTGLGHWINGGNLFWNDRAIFYTDGSGAHYLQTASSFSGGLTAGVVNYPGLVNDGQVQIDDSQSGLSDKQKAVGTKVGIGLRDSKNVMIVIGRNVNMQQFAYIFKALGAKGALNLDVGGSTALYYNGRYLAGPGRGLPNAIIFAR
jgi:exopolysaccharide biosynthesis protein